MKSKNQSTIALPISEYLDIAPRYVRSFEIERDFTDPAATDGYILTPAVLFAAQTLSSGLRKNSTQRAWRITGPYGAGKSAFGLFLSHAAARTAPGKKLLAQIKDEAPEVYAAWQAVPRYLPIAITGSRIPFGHALVVRLRRAVEAISTRRPPKLLNDLKRMESRAISARLNDEQVSDALGRFVDYAVSATQGESQGVLLLIDEMGKFLEHAALRPEQADAHVFQRIAEMAAGGSKLPLAVVGFLHQNFADYAAGYGERGQEEWSKVAQRFEDIPFDESLDQYGSLLGRAMQYKRDILRTSGIESRSRELYARVVPAEKQSGRSSALVESSPNLYPIHPATFLVLATAAKRFGQSQRSLFSFLGAAEAHGLQRFVRSTELHVDHWYRLPMLYDYLASLDGVTFRQGDRARKWELLKDTLMHGPKLEPLESDLLKAVGLLNVFDPVLYLGTDVKSLSRALIDVDDSKEARKALGALVEKGVLFYRRAQGDYCLWSHSSVDLQAIYEDAARSTRAASNLDDLLGTTGTGRSLIAHRHYQRTGTLRAFRVRYVSMAKVSVATIDEPIDEYDGEVLVVLLEPDDTIAKAAAKLGGLALSANPARLIVLRKIEQADLKIATEIRIYERIRQSCVELRVDDFARREVDQNLDRVRRQLEERLAKVASFAQTTDHDDIAWLYLGKAVEVETRRDLSMRLSSICKKVYDASPIIQNELINRHKLSSAISLARQRLIAAMLARGGEPGLGLVGMPPERTIYLSLFQETGLHSKVNGVLGFHPPQGKDAFRWGPAWKGLRDYLVAQGSVSFEKVLAFLGQRPYGIRQGPALLIIFALILFERRNIAIFERKTYLIDFTEDHARRLIKSPANFELHLQPAVGGVRGLFGAYAAALEPIKEAGDVLTDAHGVVACLYKWHAHLSEYAHQTLRLSSTAKEVRSVLKRAMDPVDLLTKNLPIACGYAEIDKAKKNDLDQFASTLGTALQEIREADNDLRHQICFVLGDALGIQGSINELRVFLRKNFGPYNGALGDHKLKATLTRVVDVGLSDDAWIESIAALLGERSIALWKDETLDKFKAETIEFSGKLKRWVELMLHLKSKPSSASLVSVYVTGTSGKEHSLLVTDPPQVRASSEELKKELRRVIAMNPDEAPQALAQALAEVLSDPVVKETKKRGKNK
jgi:hypothetical protein